MKQLKHPATIVAALALFVALAGGAGAASVLMSGSHLRNHSVAEKKLTKRAIRALRGHRGPRGPQGAAGPQGPAGTALAYAHITSTGTLDETNSAGVTAANFTHNGPGEYCFKGLSFTTKNVVATVDAAGAGTLAGTSAHTTLGDSTYCPTGTQVAVVTTSDTAAADYGVYIVFN
jgi:hypothetical protein